MKIQFFNGNCLRPPRETVEQMGRGVLITLGVNPCPKRLGGLRSPQIPHLIEWLPTTNLLFVLPPEMVLVPRSEWRSRSGSSQALYPSYWETPWWGAGGGILLQILSAETEEGAYTSCHCHRLTTERFYPVYGHAELWRPEYGWQQLHWGTQIDPGSPHQLRVKDGFALTVIRMEGPYSVRGADCMDDHCYVAQPVSRNDTVLSL
jgi:hypothetical protein